MTERDRFWIEEVVEQAQKALDYAGHEDEVHLMAMLKAVENLFEATTALSEDARGALFADAEEYQDLRGARNYYVHQYHRVDGERARLTLKRYFPGIVERANCWLAGR